MMPIPLSEQLLAVANECSVQVTFTYEENFLCESTTSCFPFPPVSDILFPLALMPDGWDHQLLVFLLKDLQCWVNEIIQVSKQQFTRIMHLSIDSPAS